MTFDKRTVELIALGASVAVNCQPCLQFHINGLGGSSFAVVFGALGRAFDPSKRSLVLGIAGAGAFFGMFIMVPYSQFFINYWGWFESLIILAITCALRLPRFHNTLHYITIRHRILQ